MAGPSYPTHNEAIQKITGGFLCSLPSRCSDKQLIIASIFTAAFTGLFVNGFDAKDQPQQGGIGCSSQLTPLGAPAIPPGGG